MGMDILQTNCPSRQKGHLGVRGSTIKTFVEAVRLAPTLVHVCGFIWEWTYAKYKSPLNSPGGISGGGLGCHKFKSLLNVSNDWTDWHQIWHISGNGYTPNKLPLETQGGTWGFSWTDLHQLWFTSADSSGNGNRLNPRRPSIHQGELGGGG